MRNRDAKMKEKYRHWWVSWFLISQAAPSQTSMERKIYLWQRRPCAHLLNLGPHSFQLLNVCPWRNPLQCSCLENPRDGGAWWAAIYGVAQSRTRLTQLSSSSVYMSVPISQFIPPFPDPLGIKDPILKGKIYLEFRFVNWYSLETLLQFLGQEAPLEKE